MFGILNLHKSSGRTSRDVVNRIVPLVKPDKVGHAGTLDPMASGVLLVCVGQATRLISELQRQHKVYRAVFEFGKTSNTDDITGTILSTTPPPMLSKEALENLLPAFTGTIQQVPPQFSAVHVSGKRAYHLARIGKHVNLQPKPVEIHRLEILHYDYPQVHLEIECGSGTYIRSLARDLGERIGCGGLMTDLVRTRIGSFMLEDAIEPDQLTCEFLENDLHSPLLAVPDLPRCICTDDVRAAIRQGRPVEIDSNHVTVPNEETLSPGVQVALIDQQANLLAIAQLDETRDRLSPRMVFLK